MWAVIIFLFFHFWDIIESFCINQIAIRKLNLFGFGIVREHKIEELLKYDSWRQCTLSSGIQPTEVTLSQTLTPLALFSLPIYFLFHLSPSLSIFLPQSSTKNSIFCITTNIHIMWSSDMMYGMCGDCVYISRSNDIEEKYIQIIQISYLICL